MTLFALLSSFHPREREGESRQVVHSLAGIPSIQRCSLSLFLPSLICIELEIVVDGAVDLSELESKTANWTRRLLLVICVRMGPE
ncbi:hypothetical protein PMAYCL1PPCAC_06961 [Pristionchus mayeri]|uniref:Uncharacterized protein n=1 Tax=Pristionchus mayeri TaxID=1317129 RepID=A0AAN4Z9W1_9BILA|nr:hypothetical protein PMAYCL1PPCAC_06961 [Pristionchus mayeri]